jgi:DNA-binding NtrC family response regulator
MQSKIIAIDDEPDFLDTLRRGLVVSGYRNVVLESDPDIVVQRLEGGEVYDAALIDITLPGISGIDLLERFKALSPWTECIMVTAIDEARVAMACLHKGAYDYLVKPISKDDLVTALSRALERKRFVDILNMCKMPEAPKLETPEAFANIVATDMAMVKILREAEMDAPCNDPILISGEPGTGKKLLTRSIHLASARGKKQYARVTIDSALSGQDIAAQIFGRVGDSDAHVNNDLPGVLEATHGGTLVIDGIDRLPLDLQGKLLRVLQIGAFTKVNASSPQKADVRFIAVTTAHLGKLSARDGFRNDLYCRLRENWLHLPPLRQRKCDILPLIDHFTPASEQKPPESAFTPEAVSCLLNYAWPGNVAELKAVVQSAVRQRQGQPISSADLPDHVVNHVSAFDQRLREVHGVTALAEVEKQHILKIFQQVNQDLSQSAQLLEISLSTLRRRLERYGAL